MLELSKVGCEDFVSFSEEEQIHFIHLQKLGIHAIYLVDFFSS